MCHPVLARTLAACCLAAPVCKNSMQHTALVECASSFIFLTSAYAVTHSLACTYNTNTLLYNSLLLRRFLFLNDRALNSSSCKSKQDPIKVLACSVLLNSVAACV